MSHYLEYVVLIFCVIIYVLQYWLFSSNFKGGGWCATPKTCLQNSKKPIGTSKQLNNSMQLKNILSKNAKENPGINTIS